MTARPRRSSGQERVLARRDVASSSGTRTPAWGSCSTAVTAWISRSSQVPVGTDIEELDLENRLAELDDDGFQVLPHCQHPSGRRRDRGPQTNMLRPGFQGPHSTGVPSQRGGRSCLRGQRSSWVCSPWSAIGAPGLACSW